MMGKYLRALALAEIGRGELAPGPSLLLLVVADKVRDDIGQLYAGDREVASWVGRSPSTMRGWRRHLIAAGVWKPLGAPRRGVAIKYQIFPRNIEPTERRGRALDEDAMQRIQESKVNGGPARSERRPRSIEHQSTSPKTTEENDLQGDGSSREVSVMDEAIQNLAAAGLIESTAECPTCLVIGGHEMGCERS